jgi:hypothetical protein
VAIDRPTGDHIELALRAVLAEFDQTPGVSLAPELERVAGQRGWQIVQIYEDQQPTGS